MSLNVNVSGLQLQKPDIVPTVVAALEVSGIAPSSLVLEITESVLMKDSATTLGRLRELKELGVRLALDDFGTGYSSMNYLLQFPVDYLKIDRAFVSALTTGEDAMRLTRTILALGDALGLESIAEGIECYQELDALCSLGCRMGQGYYVARPMPADALESYLVEHTAQLSAHLER
jgi:EAL domain-containing protein (putative c-di-GMP-specific phosphodiesterase class I)